MFFLIIGSMTIFKELQSSIFIRLVGVEFVPIAKTLSVFLMIPFVLIYSYFVDKLTNTMLLSRILLFFGLFGVIFGVFLGTDRFGIYNQEMSPFRVLGWLFYWYIDAFPPFIVSTFWAFTNSLHTPDEAKKNYSFLVSSSKMGGMFGASIGYLITSGYISSSFSGEFKTLLLIFCGSFFLLLGSLVVFSTRKKPNFLPVLNSNLAAKEAKKSEKKKTGIFEGLFLLFKKPYTLGIFATVLSFEVVNQVVNYQRLLFNSEKSSSIDSLNSMLYYQAFFPHFCGFFISIIGTTYLFRVLGIRKTLILVPLLIFMIVLWFMISPTGLSITVAYTGVHAICYAIVGPLRENLYVITSRDIQFKVKAWIDSVGMRISKTTGQQINLLSGLIHKIYGAAVSSHFTAGIFGLIIVMWIFVAYKLGNKYTACVRDKQVIE